jgi:hypothetical protein
MLPNVYVVLPYKRPFVIFLTASQHVSNQSKSP